MDTGFHHDQTLSSALNRHTISFQSSAMDSTSEMIMMGNYCRMNSTAGMMFSGNSGMASSSSLGFAQVGNSCGSVLCDLVPGLKHDAGLAVEWSVEEQYKLEEGLSNLLNPSITTDSSPIDVCRDYHLLVTICPTFSSFEQAMVRGSENRLPGRLGVRLISRTLSSG